MDSEQTTEADVDSQNNEGESEQTTTEDVVTLSREDYDKLNQSLGSFKKQVKDLKKVQDSSKDETPQKTETTNDNTALLERLDTLALKTAGVKDKDEIELAKDFKKRTGLEMDEVVSDDIFLARLEKLREKKSNELASSDIRGGTGANQAKNTPEYWKAKGAPPTPQDVPDRKTRAKIVREMMADAAGKGIKFYNS